VLPCCPDPQLDKELKVHVSSMRKVCSSQPTPSQLITRSPASISGLLLTAAAKALDHRLKPKRSRSRLPDPSRSSALDTISSGQFISSPITSGSPTQTASTASSTAPSLLDLTKPIINASAANAANKEELDVADLETEASTDSDASGSVDQQDDAIPSTGIVTVRGVEPMIGSSNIVSERVSTHGRIRPFEPIGEIPALDPNLREHLGQVHGSGVIQKWVATRAEWDEKYLSQLAKWRQVRRDDRARAEAEGFLTRDLQGERPPLCSLAGWYDQKMAREVGRSVDEFSGKASGAMMMWMRVSSNVR